jgi:opacity protein-like surface antigen
MSSPLFAPSRSRDGSPRRTTGRLPVLFMAAVLLALTLLPTPGVAQGSPSFWGGIGVGTGSARLSCDICTNDRTAGMSGSAAVGFGVGQRVRLGVEGNAWRDKDGELETLLWSASLVGYLYPAGSRAFWTKLGAGIMRYQAEDARDDIDANTFGLLVGAGYDIPMTGSLSVGPYVTLATSSRADLKSGDRTIRERVSHSLLHLGVVFHLR